MEGMKGIYIIIFFYHIIHDTTAQENPVLATYKMQKKKKK